LPNSPVALCFGEYRLDTGSGSLWRDGRALHLTPKAFDLLRFLAARPGELVAKKTLFDAIWPGTAVTDDALTRCVGEVRRALGDDPHQPTFIETVHRRGFRFLAPVTPRAAGRGRARAFVGREPALERGRAMLAEALAGRAQLLFVYGEPGVGKTRLAEEIAELARREGAAPVWGRAHEGEGRPPYWIWTQVLRGAGERTGAGDLSRVFREASATSRELVARRGDAEARFEIFDEVARLLARAAASQPLCVVLDDLHAADPDSLRMLCFVAQELVESRLLVVGTYRDVGSEPNPALAEALGTLALARDGRALLELRGLPRDDVRRLLAQLVNDETAERFADTLHQKTGGNPLYLHELVRLFVEEGPSETSTRWRGTAPETVRQVLQRRLDGLSPTCREALVLAAVAGAEFSVRLLGRAAESGAAACADGIHEAEAHRLVAREGDEARFAHGLLREVLYEGLRPGVRARLHRRLALAIEASAATKADPPLASLAHHFGRAVLGGDLAKAVHYARLAGEHATATLAFEEAAAHFESVLALLESALPLDARAQCEAELAAARAHFLCGRPERAHELAAQALQRARSEGSADLVYEASATFCELQPSYERHPAQVRILEHALALLPDDASGPRARLLGLRGMLAFIAAEPDAHLACGREAVELARRSGDRRVLLDSLRCLCFALLHPSQEGEWRERYEEMIGVASEERRAGLEFDARLFKLEHAMQVGPPDAIERELRALDGVAERLRTPGARAALLRARAGLALARGAFDDAQHLAESALAVGRAADAPLARAVSLLQLATLRHAQCRVDETLPEVASGAALNPEIAMFQAGVIWVLCESGARDEAQRRLHALACANFAALPRDVTYPMALANLALSCGRLAARDGAERLLELLLPYAGRTLTLLHYFSSGCASRQLGVLAGLLERWHEADAHFQTALAVDGRMGARPWQAFTLVDYARMLRARGTPRACAQAADLLRTARELAREIGMPVIEQEVAALAP
jgi:DNA-binding winged helix-turn-helix (wHTH) protein/tetratricopeptide (TPR) repeat protein